MHLRIPSPWLPPVGAAALPQPAFDCWPWLRRLTPLGCLLLAFFATRADTFKISGTAILDNGTNWVGGGVDGLDQSGIQSKEGYPIKIVREVVQDLSECPIYSSDGAISNALGWLHPLQDVVNYNRSKGAVTILCPFGWDAGTNRILVGLTPSATPYYSQFKLRLAAMAQAFTNQSDVWIDVWNEPYDWQNIGFAESQWVSDMVDLYDTIRRAGNTNIILVPGQANDAQETVLLDQNRFLSGRYNVLAEIHCYNGWTTGSQSNSQSRIEAIRAAGWALIFGEVGRDATESDCTRLLDAAVQEQVTSLAWSWSASDGSALQSWGTPTDWGNEFFPYLPLLIPVTGVPPPPDGLTAAPAAGQAVLTWLPSPGAATYNIERSLAGAGDFTLVASGVPGPAYSDATAVGGATNVYAVAAVNNSGASAFSGCLGVAVPVGCVADDADAAGVTITGAWTSSTYNSGYYGADYLHDGDTGNLGGKSVRFSPNLPVTGTYDVYARWTASANRATNVPMDIISAGGTNTVLVNQQQSNAVWVLLGAFNFNAGTNGSVVVRNDGASGYVIADAVEFVAAALAPALSAIANQAIVAGAVLQVTNRVTDPNLPRLALTFRLLSAPAGATINSNNGVLYWRPAMAQAGTTNDFGVAINDAGGSGLGATQQFVVTVSAPLRPVLQSAGFSPAGFAANVSGSSGPDYSVYVSTNLANWRLLFTSNAPTVPFLLADPAATNFSRRFYRVQLGP